jgi:hypothetical protein
MLILGPTNGVNYTIVATTAVVVVVCFYRRKSHVNFLVVMCIGYQKGGCDPRNGATRNRIEIGVQTGYSSQGR